MSENFIVSKHAESDEGVKYEISYFILAENVVDSDGSYHKGFGVKVSIAEEGAPEKKKSTTIRDITTKKDTITYIVDIISRNLVTPIGLLNVIEDTLLM